MGPRQRYSKRVGLAGTGGFVFNSKRVFCLTQISPLNSTIKDGWVERGDECLGLCKGAAIEQALQLRCSADGGAVPQRANTVEVDPRTNAL